MLPAPSVGRQQWRNSASPAVSPEIQTEGYKRRRALQLVGLIPGWGAGVFVSPRFCISRVGPGLLKECKPYMNVLLHMINDLPGCVINDTCRDSL